MSNALSFTTKNLQRAIGIGEYICEGHTTAEAAVEFRIGLTTVQHSIKLLACEEKTQFLWVKVQRMIKKLSAENRKKADSEALK